MKKLTKNSVAKSFKIIVDIIIFFQLLFTIICIPGLFQNPDFLVVRLEQFIELVVFLIMLIYIRMVIKAFNNNLFYDNKIVSALKKLSILFILYVIVDYAFMIIKNFDLTTETTGFLFADIIYYYIKPIKFSLLFLAAISYLLSFVVKEGCELKEENSLMI